MAGAPAPYPEGDPRNAKYFENLAALEHQKGLAEAEDKRGREEAEASYKYGTEALAKAEPLSLRANMNRANTEGILRSGVEAGRYGQTQTQYLAKGHALSETRRKAVEAYNRGDQRAREAFEHGSHDRLIEAQEHAKAELEANPPAAAAASAAPPTVVGQVAQPSTASGIKWSRDPRVRERQLRELASKRAVG